jgi:predicted AAA+ superfamily ATPase
VPVSSLKTVSDLIEFSRILLEKQIDAQALYRKFLLSGGFLKVIDAMMKQQSFADVVALYKTTLQSELAKFGRKEANMREVVRKLIRSIASETSYTNIAEEAELGSKNTAVEYLNFLTESFFLLELFFYNISERRLVLKKNKKYYPSDPFLFWIFHAFIAGTDDVEGIYKTYLLWPKDAQLAEAFVASELHKKKFAVSFSSGTKELDFYIPHLELGVEVKYKEKITRDDLESLRIAKRKILVSKDTLEDRNDVLIVPAYLFGFLEISA